MKRLITLFLFFSMYYVSAQDVAPSTYLPQGGEKNLEVRSAPLGNNPISFPGIKYRKFKSADKAFRLAFSPYLHWDSEYLTADKKELNLFTSFSLSAGIEHHIPSTERLSVYFGYQGTIGANFNKNTVKQDPFKVKSTDGDLWIGIKGFAGVDYYIVRNIYLGTEIGYGIGFTKGLGRTLTTSTGDKVKLKGGSQFNLRQSYTAELRLGWLF